MFTPVNCAVLVISAVVLFLLFRPVINQILDNLALKYEIRETLVAKITIVPGDLRTLNLFSSKGNLVGKVPNGYFVQIIRNDFCPNTFPNVLEVMITSEEHTSHSKHQHGPFYIKRDLITQTPFFKR